jgi:8-oxo-dGTP pyrophosphatase MutT (NUDIX family)
MLYTAPPPGFQSQSAVVSALTEYDGKILLLLRPGHKPQGGKWGFPTGKVEYWEIHIEALVREVLQETGIRTGFGDFLLLRTVYVIHPECSFAYHLYRFVPPTLPKVRINPGEHLAFRWAEPEESLGLPLVDDLPQIIREYYGLGEELAAQEAVIPL